MEFSKNVCKMAMFLKIPYSISYRILKKVLYPFWGVKSWIIHCVAAQIVSNRIIIFHAVLDETALIKFMFHFTDLKDLRVSILQFTANLLKKVHPHLGYPPVLFSSRSWLYIYPCWGKSLKYAWGINSQTQLACPENISQTWTIIIGSLPLLVRCW
jgi:hypothetical protein